MATASLDPEYREAHDRRVLRQQQNPAQEGRRPGIRRFSVVTGSVVTGSALLLAGLITGISAGQVRQEAKAADAGRAALVEEVRRETAATDALTRDETALRTDVRAIQTSALSRDAQGRALAAQLAQLELDTGSVAVHGPGLVVTLGEAPRPATPDPGGGDADGRIYDRDLQEVANALWAAGAEQIAINGRRLTALTAIRSAGEAVLVDFRPLTPPYVLKAIGEVDAMESRFADSPVARTLKTWTSLYGISFEIRRAEDLTLPAAGPADLRLARVGAR